MNKKTLIKKIRTALLKGNTINYIKKQLIKRGVKIKAIKEAVKEVYKTHIKNIKKYIKTEIEFGYKVEDIKRYLISIGHQKRQVNHAIKELGEKTLGKKTIDEKKIRRRKKAEETTKLKKLIEKELEEIKESLEEKENILKEKFKKLEPWKKGAVVGFFAVVLISFVTEIFMMLSIFAETGGFNCYSPYRLVDCTNLQGLLYYLLLFVAFTLVFAIPAAVIAALINHFVWRKVRDVPHKNTRTNLQRA